MEEINLPFTWLPSGQAAGLTLPVYATMLAAGMDVGAAITGPLVLEPGDIRVVACGFAVAIPEGYEMQVRPRSGLAVKHGITVINAPGTIDADYRGEIKVGLINLGKAAYTVNPGDRIAQLILSPVVRAVVQVVATLVSTDRGSGGFGHTGMHGVDLPLPGSDRS